MANLLLDRAELDIRTEGEPWLDPADPDEPC